MFSDNVSCRSNLNELEFISNDVRQTFMNSRNREKSAIQSIIKH